MSNRVKWIKYNEKDILYIDYSNCVDDDDLMQILDEAEKEYLKFNKSVLLNISNVTNIHFSQKFKNGTDALINKLNNKGIKRIHAIIGVTKLQRIIANAVKKDVYFAKSVEDAKEWLIKQSE